MSDIYKFAAQNKLRFASNRGGSGLTIEQLFELPLKSPTGLDLDNVAKIVNTELKSMTEESFVEDASINPRKVALEIGLAICKDVIATKQAENAAHRAKIDRAEKRRKILDAINAKDDAALTTATKEELEKQLAALD